MMRIETWFTFQEILNASQSAPVKPHDVNTSATWFTDALAEYELKYNIVGLDSSFTDADVKDIVNVLMTQVYNRHSKDYFYKVDEDKEQPSQSDFDNAMIKLINVINMTAPRYIPMLKQFKEASKDPIKPVSSTSTGVTKFNDTPQDEGDFGDDEHNTNITNSTNTTTADSDSLMNRLEQMFKNFRSLILDWTNDFNILFFKEEQL